MLLLFALLQSPPPLRIDVGAPGDAPFLAGFFLPETDSRTTFRWSGAESSVLLPGAAGTTVSLAMRLNGDVRVEHGLAQIDLLARESDLGTFELHQGWRVYRILLPAQTTVGPALAPASFTLRAAPYQHEQRALGVPVDWLRFDPLGSGSATFTIPLQRTALFGGVCAVLLSRSGLSIAGLLFAGVRGVCCAWSLRVLATL